MSKRLNLTREVQLPHHPENLVQVLDEDCAAPTVMHHAHHSEIAALGAALLRMRIPEVMQVVFLSGLPGFGQHIADAVCMELAVAQRELQGKVLGVPPAFVNEVRAPQPTLTHNMSVSQQYPECDLLVERRSWLASNPHSTGQAWSCFQVIECFEELAAGAVSAAIPPDLDEAVKYTVDVANAPGVMSPVQVRSCKW